MLQQLMRGAGRSRGGGKIRLLIGLAIAAFSLISYYSSSEYNEVTGEEQRVSLTPDQEIALGLQATPQMVEQFGGLNPDPRKQAFVDEIRTGGFSGDVRVCYDLDHVEFAANS